MSARVVMWYQRTNEPALSWQIIASDSLNLPTTSDYKEAQHPLYQKAIEPGVQV